jgi:hypothetical protein
MAPWIFWEIASLGIVSLFIAQLIAQQQPHSTERLAVQFLLWNADFLAGLRKKHSPTPNKNRFPGSPDYKYLSFRRQVASVHVPH